MDEGVPEERGEGEGGSGSTPTVLPREKPDVALRCLYIVRGIFIARFTSGGNL